MRQNTRKKTIKSKNNSQLQKYDPVVSSADPIVSGIMQPLRTALQTSHDKIFYILIQAPLQHPDAHNDRTGSSPVSLDYPNSQADSLTALSCRASRKFTEFGSNTYLTGK